MCTCCTGVGQPRRRPRKSGAPLAGATGILRQLAVLAGAALTVVLVLSRAAGLWACAGAASGRWSPRPSAARSSRHRSSLSRPALRSCSPSPGPSGSGRPALESRHRASKTSARVSISCVVKARSRRTPRLRARGSFSTTASYASVTCPVERLGISSRATTAATGCGASGRPCRPLSWTTLALPSNEQRRRVRGGPEPDRVVHDCGSPIWSSSGPRERTSPPRACVRRATGTGRSSNGCFASDPAPPLTGEAAR